jgi:hypothetical protein
LKWFGEEAMEVIEWLGGELGDEAMVDVNEIGQLGLL